MITAHTLADNLIRQIGSPFRLRITGFPACGKTTLSTFINDAIPTIAHLQSEAWIYSLDYRKERDCSGAHPGGYEIDKAVNDIRRFLDGKSIFVRNYDHLAGDRVGGSVVVPALGAPVVLDGTLFSLADFDGLVPACIFLQPASLEQWLQSSIRRDVETRFFSEAEATRHNMRKARDMDFVLQRSPKAQVITCHIPMMLYTT